MSGLAIFIIVAVIAIICWLYFYKKGSGSITESMKTAETEGRLLKNLNMNLDDPFKNVIMTYTMKNQPHEISVDFTKRPVTLAQIINKASSRDKSIVVGISDKDKTSVIDSVADDVKIKAYKNAFIVTKGITLETNSDYKGIIRTLIEGLHIYDADEKDISHLGELVGPVIVIAKDSDKGEELIRLGFTQLFKHVYIKNLGLITKVDPVD